MRFIEVYRHRAFEELFKVKSFHRSFATWDTHIRDITSDYTDPDAIYELGSKLSEIFALTGKAGRTQSDVSSGGTVWESLVAWYLNMVLSGTRGVAFRQKKALMPERVSDAICVTYGTYETNTESDVVALLVSKKLAEKELEIELDKRGSSKKFKKTLDDAIRAELSQTSMVNVQCKTNWNDNAQVPMLWDIAYSVRSFHRNSVSIGRNGASITDLEDFRYAFVTVPTQKSEIKSGSMAVKRVENCSGGNFWGHKTKAGVAQSLSEIFKRNLSGAFSTSVQESIAKAIHDEAGWFSYMKTLDYSD